MLCVNTINNVIYILQPGVEEFIRHELDIFLGGEIDVDTDLLNKPLLGESSSFAMLEDKLYCLTDNTKSLAVATFDDTSQLQFTYLIMEDFTLLGHPYASHSRNYLIECCGELLLVQKMLSTRDEVVVGFMIFKFDFTTGSKWKLIALEVQQIFFLLVLGKALRTTQQILVLNEIQSTSHLDVRVFFGFTT